MDAPLRTILINGAGIAGMTAALAFAAKGYRVEVFERADGFEIVGAGIQISPNAFRILAALGLEQQLKTVASTPDAILMMNATTGREVTRIPLAETSISRYGTPYLVIHRADLQNMLFAACSEHPEINIRFSSEVVDIASHSNGVTTLVRNQKSMHEYPGKILVAADGVWSKLRTSLFDIEEPVYSGTIAWRALVPFTQIRNRQAHNNTMLWMGPAAHAVTYPVRGGRYLNVVAITREKNRQDHNSFEIAGDDLQKRFSRWHENFSEVFDTRHRWTGWPIYETPVVKTMAKGPVALIGDAAHAVLPFAAQGAALAIEDAAVLANFVAVAPNMLSALAEFEQSRIGRVNRIRKQARKNGRIYHLPRVPAMFRDYGLRRLSSEKLLAQQDWIYKWQA